MGVGTGRLGVASSVVLQSKMPAFPGCFTYAAVVRFSSEGFDSAVSTEEGSSNT